MKEFSKELSRFTMEYDGSLNARSEFELVLRVEEYVKNYKNKLYKNDEGISYFLLAANQMMEDIHDYLEEYRNQCPANEFYQIHLISNHRSKRMCIVADRNVRIRFRNLKQAVDSFPQYTIYSILGLDFILGEDIKRKQYLIKEEYDRFLGLRKANPLYFVPFIRDILKMMKHNVEVV